MSEGDTRMLEASETNEVVKDIAQKMWFTGMVEIMKIHPEQRFLLWSRVIAFVFDYNFKIMIRIADKKIEEIEKAQGEK